MQPKLFNQEMQIAKRVLALNSIRMDSNYGRKEKITGDKNNTNAKTKSQLDFEADIQEKPVITDMKYFKQ